jgi:hypothetical protein
LLTKGFELGFNGLEAGPAGGNLQLGRFTVGPFRLADRLPEKVKPLGKGGNDRFGW